MGQEERRRRHSDAKKLGSPSHSKKASARLSSFPQPLGESQLMKPTALSRAREREAQELLEARKGEEERWRDSIWHPPQSSKGRSLVASSPQAMSRLLEPTGALITGGKIVFCFLSLFFSLLSLSLALTLTLTLPWPGLTSCSFSQ